MKDYPFSKVVCFYPLIGGLIGGLLMGVFAMSGEGNLDRWSKFFDYLGGILFIAFFGIFVGLIPAGITGFIVGKLALYKDKLIHYPIMFVVGFIISAIYIFIWLLINTGTNLNISESFIMMGVIGLVGGMSSMITGFILLPKQSDSLGVSNDNNVL